MATQAYQDWVARGRHWTLAKPLREYASALISAGFAQNGIGTIGDERHLHADPPEDHTPFSSTGWPDEAPLEVVTALDLNSVKGSRQDWDTVARYWIQEARAGRTPWVKRIIFQGRHYDVRYAWEARPILGHYDHVHVGIRTDWVSRSIGDWPIIGEDSRMALRDETLTLPGERLPTGQETPGYPGQETIDAATALAYALRNAWRGQAYALRAVELLEGLSVPVVDPIALANALADNEKFVNELSTAVAAKLGLVPTAREMAKAIGELVWHGKAES